MSLLFIAVVAALAFANGANDNFKGAATLWGGGELTYRQVWWLANGATLLGGFLAFTLGGAVAQTFSAKGVVPPASLNSCAFALAFAAGAAGTVLLATFLRFPISTTHSILGSLAGAGAALVTDQVDLQPLVRSAIAPLLTAPALAAGLTFLVWNLSRPLRRATRTPTARRSLRRLAHIASGSAVCFARAVNDAPKIASIALLGAASDASAATIYGGVAIVMTAGGVAFSRRIADVMSRKITEMDASEGLTANLVTAFLVLFASKFGLAVSTTHVAVGSLFGLGATTRKGHGRKIAEIFLSWVLTLPIAFAIGFLVARIVAGL